MGYSMIKLFVVVDEIFHLFRVYDESISLFDLWRVLRVFSSFFLLG